MDTHQETEYVLSNPILMEQIRQSKDKSEQDSTKPNKEKLCESFWWVGSAIVSLGVEEGDRSLT